MKFLETTSDNDEVASLIQEVNGEHSHKRRRVSSESEDAIGSPLQAVQRVYSYEDEQEFDFVMGTYGRFILTFYLFV